MQNLLILYNPYYNQEMIEDHIRILNVADKPAEAKVGFGKIRSKIRNYEHSQEVRIDALCETVTQAQPMQLFLTDFSSMYVCRVEAVVNTLEGIVAPEYYESLDVERWFVVTDMREIMRDDFEYVRDQVLVQFTTPNYGNHTYALYGNRYDYPLEVQQKTPLNYFENFHTGERHFTKVFKSSRYAATQQELRHYVFGKKLLYALHPDSLESIVGAEVQYDTHKDNATHDFASIVILYAKAFENESYYLLRKVFEELMGYDASLEQVEYQVQGRDYALIDYLTHKPNIGTNKYLLSNPRIYQAYKECYKDYRQYAELLSLLTYDLKKAISTIQNIRNEASHGSSIHRDNCDLVRSLVLGVGRESIMVNILKCSTEYFEA